MKLENIHHFFEYPPPTYLCTELAVCYILFVLLQGESYGTELIQRLEAEYPSYRLSDTVLYSAIKFLEDEGALAGYWKKLEGRGRPRRMYQILPEWEEHSQDLARLWHEYTDRRDGIVDQQPESILPDKLEYISYTQVPFVYSIWLSVSSKKITVGNELVVDIYISPGRVKHINSYLFEVNNNQAIGNDINLFLIAPGFSIHGDNVSSLCLDENIDNIRQHTSFRLTAILSLEMLFCLHQTLNFVHQQEQPAIEKLIIKHKGKFSLLKVSKKIQKLQDGEELLAHFYQNQYNILHFACHCRPCRQYEDDVDALIISLQEEDNHNAQQIELEVKNFNRVNGVFLTQPLIFLNACQSAGGVDELRKTFNLPNKFIQYGAAAVIATACPMPDVFAAAFAKVFYEFFIGKKMLIGKALCETRRYFLEKYNNPLGLAYGLYSPHDYQIAQSPAFQAIAKPAKTPVGIG
ncbi:MAG: CHAT domain-containing protein [Calothrix sp. CSU_2_0]|nr:CHAT domain-containing protein [Calothrix sp. CSU_2_0]